jgi:hypothetical protein
MSLTQKRLKEVLHYDPDTGAFTWLVTNSNRATVGSVAGSIHNVYGYRVIKIDNESYRAHRLVWLYMYGSLPNDDVHIDHKDGNRDNNRFGNLREATLLENAQNTQKLYKNSTSGHAGVSWDGRSKKWRAHITVCGKHINLGRYTTLEEAKAVRDAAKPEHHPFHYKGEENVDSAVGI